MQVAKGIEHCLLAPAGRAASKDVCATSLMHGANSDGVAAGRDCGAKVRAACSGELRLPHPLLPDTSQAHAPAVSHEEDREGGRQGVEVELPATSGVEDAASPRLASRESKTFASLEVRR